MNNKKTQATPPREGHTQFPATPKNKQKGKKEKQAKAQRLSLEWEASEGIKKRKWMEKDQVMRKGEAEW